MNTSYRKKKINKIIISNGHFNFFLGELAQNLEKDNRLDRFIMSGYPGAGLIKFLTKIKFNKDILYRLSSRRKNISDKLVFSLWVTEFFMQTAQKIRNIKIFSEVCEFLDILSLKIYSLSAKKCIKNSNAKYYHYRSGYGLASAKLAKKRGMVLICDHSIAHPYTVDYLINNEGSIPKAISKDQISKFWNIISEDINIADYVIVNSDFVKHTFMNHYSNPENVFVAYSGVDDLSILNVKQYRKKIKYKKNRRLKFLFCGKFEKRKGSDILIEALKNYPNKKIDLEIIGVPKENINQVKKLLSDLSNVKIHGFINKDELLKKMISSDVFIFPTLCEGSARVVFQAMLCGCYIITTSNSGSIVKNHIHGAIVEPGSYNALKNKMLHVESLDTDCIKNIGENNSEEIISNFDESAYYENIKTIYTKIEELRQE